MTEKEKEYKFSCKVQKCTYNTSDFRIYATDVDGVKYPEIKKNKYGNVTILGEVQELTLGVDYEVTAIEQESRYGISYKVLNIKRNVPTTEKDMFLFLSEILTENQAKTLYNAYPDIVQRVKENRLDDIDFSKLKGIKEYTFNVIKNKIVENFCLSDLVIEFQGYLTLSVIKKIYNKYPSIEVLKEKLKKDPYKCLCGLAGIGFKTADSILLDIEKVSKKNIANGKPPIVDFETDLASSSQRCLSCLLYLLSENEGNGHTKMNLAELRKSCMNMVPACSHHFSEAVKSSSIYYNKENMEVSLSKTYEIEYDIAKTILNALYNNCNVWDFDVEKYRIVNGSSLSDEQIQAVSNVCKYSISILNGSGGTGKSFSTQAVINMLKEHRKTFRLFSPTGKAAKVLSDYTKEKASTIHRGLMYNPAIGWMCNEENKLTCDIVIIDEFSMVDIHLFKHFIDAVDFAKTKLLLIGDNAQLPSVSCGNLLHDFMQTKLIPTTTLTKVFRYGEGGLMKVATDVRCCKPYLNSSMKSKMTSFGSNKDYSFVDLPSEAIPANTVALYKKLLAMGNSIEDIQVLTAKNVGDCGANKLNNMIQKVANPNYGSNNCMKVGDVTYYEGDLVIQKVNNYKAELVFKNNDDFDESETAFVANGESGIVKEIYKSYMIIDFDGICVRYYRGDMLNVGLGYSITIHKSQGSSIENVILCTPQSHTFMLNSNLIYVGLTRMKKRCFHLGTLSSVNMAIKKKANLSRETFMQQLLLTISPEEYKNVEKPKKCVENKYAVSEQLNNSMVDVFDDVPVMTLPPDNELPWYTDSELENIYKNI